MIALTFCTAVPVSAQFQPRDLLASVAPIPAFQNTTEPSIQVYTAASSFRSTIDLPTNFVPLDLNFYNSTLFGSIIGAIYSISPSGSLSGVAGPAGSFVFDANGNLYVADQAALKKYDSSFSVVLTFSLPQFASHIDLAADQCMMYYISAPQGPVPALIPATIARYNVCTAQSLSPLPTAIPTLGSIGALRVLPGNDVLLGTDTGILRIRPDGTIAQTYSGGPQIALDADRTSFWEAGRSDRVRKLDLASGSEIAATVPYGVNMIVFSLTVIGEPRAAVASPPAIPTISEWLLIGLGITLAIVGLSAFKD